MMHAIKSASGRTIHVVPDNEPVFTYSEVVEMSLAGYGPEQAEFVALVKAIFPAAGKLTFPDIPHTAKEQMTMAYLGNFNTDDVPERDNDFTPLPAGDYPAIITSSEMKANSTGTGSFLKLEFTVQGDNYAGRKLFANLNLDNPSAQAVEIARADLANITRACGKKVIEDSEELHNIPLMITVGIEKRKDTGEDTNRIKRYAASGHRTAAAPSKPAPPRAAAPAGNRPPWQKVAA